MLQSPTLPESWRALLDAFRPAFRRSRTFALFALLATGLVTQTTRRTVVGMLAGAGMAAAVSFHAVCRFFSHHVWDTDRIGLTLARLIVSRLLAADAAIEVVVDDTLFRLLLITLAITLSMRGSLLRPSSWGKCPERPPTRSTASGDPVPASG